ncbi:MAG: shikimate kinase [Alphaproteobacteria bacterium]
MRRLEKTIVLVGMMGAGKTAVGRRLAAALDVPFRDADAEIEAAAGCAVSEIFSRYGEAEFRSGERKVVTRLLKEPPHVLATGGGAFIDAQLRKAIKSKAISVWLNANINVLAERVTRKGTRPLLKDGEPREVLERLLHERAPIYSEADITVDSGNEPHATVVERIVRALEKRMGPI